MKKFYSIIILSLIAFNILNAQYCASSATQTADEDIFNVTLGGLSNTTNCATAPPAGIQNRYSDFTASGPTTNIFTGVNYPFGVTIGLVVEILIQVLLLLSIGTPMETLLMQGRKYMLRQELIQVDLLSRFLQTFWFQALQP
ncbi:MAG: hypothetical protein IPK03_00005 [Bacteroidetes bacterium]|nr:hypothetical protein [Bacteroidota bacterium]